MEAKKGFIQKFGCWMVSLFRVWRREFRMVFGDIGVLLFFLFLPFFYPIVYTLIYNTETLKDINVVVVDESRTPESRHLGRMVDATQAMQVYDYVSNMDEARRLMKEHKCYGVLLIPEDYAKNLGRGEQSVVTFYSDMSLLLRFRSFVSALTEIQMDLGTQIQTREIAMLGLPASSLSGAPVESESIMLGDPTQGFASFIIPGILVLIIQQSLILGVTMLAAGSRERRRRNGGIDPLAVDAGPLATITGKMLCYLVIYIPAVYYALHIVPTMFSLPHIGDVGDYLVFIMPMVIASSFMGLAISSFVTERESSMLVVVFTSVVFLFLSGLTWPRYAMSYFWQTVGDFVPATWGIEGFITMNSNASPFYEEGHEWLMLWVLTAFYGVLAYFMERYRMSGKLLRFKG